MAAAHAIKFRFRHRIRTVFLLKIGFIPKSIQEWGPGQACIGYRAQSSL